MQLVGVILCATTSAGLTTDFLGGRPLFGTLKEETAAKQGPCRKNGSDLSLPAPTAALSADVTKEAKDR